MPRTVGVTLSPGPNGGGSWLPRIHRGSARQPSLPHARGAARIRPRRKAAGAGEMPAAESPR